MADFEISNTQSSLQASQSSEGKPLEVSSAATGLVDLPMEPSTAGNQIPPAEIQNVAVLEENLQTEPALEHTNAHEQLEPGLDPTMTTEGPDQSLGVERHEIENEAVVTPSRVATPPLPEADQVSASRALKDSHERLKSSLTLSSSLLRQLTDVDSRLSLHEFELQELQGRESSTPTRGAHTTAQVEHHDEQMTNLRQKREGLLKELRNIHKEVQENKDSYERHLNALRRTQKLKREAIADAKELFSAAKESISALEALDNLLHLNRTGKFYDEYQKQKARVDNHKEILSELDRMIAESPEEKYVTDAQARIDNCQMIITELRKVIATNPARSAQINAKIADFETRINHLNSDIKVHAGRLADLKVKRAKVENEIEGMQSRTDQLHKQVTEQFQSLLVKAGYEGLENIYEGVHYLSTVATFAVAACTILQVAEGVISTSEPLMHGVEVVLPFIGVPIGAISTARGAYDTYSAVRQCTRLHKVRHVAKDLKAQAATKRGEIESRQDVGETPNIPLEVMRLEQLIGVKKVEILSNTEQSRLMVENAINGYKQSSEGIALRSAINEAQEAGNSMVEDELTGLLGQSVNRIREEVESSEEYLQLQTQVNDLQAEINFLTEVKDGYDEVQSNIEKSKVLMTFVKRQSVELGQQFAQSGLTMAAGVTSVTAGAVSIAGTCGVFTAPAGIPVGMALALAGAGISFTGFAEKVAFKAGNALYERYQISKEQFEKTEGGNLYTIGLYIREEMSQTQKPITDSVLRYMRVKDPMKFIQDTEHEMSKMATKTPKAAEFQHRQVMNLFG